MNLHFFLSYHLHLPMHPISTCKLNSVTSLILEGYSCRDVAKKTGVGKSTVSRIVKKLESNKENINTGRPSKLTPRDRRSIVNQIESGKMDNAVEATKFINSVISSQVSTHTVRRALKEEGMRAVVKDKKPYLKPAHRKTRLSFAHKYRHWTVHDWKMVIWSDETKINRFGSDGKVWVWKRKGERLSDRTTTPTVKHGGGSVMVWGCMGWNGVGILQEVEGILDSIQYVDILASGIPESREKLDLEGEGFYFQQDNDSKHTSKLAQKWFEDHGINLLDWPAQSPDLNPIEHLWEHAKRQLKKYDTPPKGVHDLWNRLAEEWDKIPPEVCQNLIESMPRRCEAVIKAKGGNTKY